MTTYSTETLTRKRQTYHVLGIFFSSLPVERDQMPLWLPKNKVGKTTEKKAQTFLFLVSLDTQVITFILLSYYSIDFPFTLFPIYVYIHTHTHISVSK